MAIVRWIGGTSSDGTVAANWSTGSIPVSGDGVVLGPDAVASLNGQTMPESGTLVTFTVEQGFSFGIGVGLNSDWLDVSMATPATVVIDGGQANAMYLNIAGAITVLVLDAPNASIGEFGLNLKGTGGTAAALDIRASSTASIGVATQAGILAKYDTISVTGASIAEFGEGVTTVLNTLPIVPTISGGNVRTFCAIGVAVMTGGTLTHESGVVASLTAIDSTINYNSTGLLSAMNITNTLLDLSGDLRTKQIGDDVADNVLGAGAEVRDPSNVAGWAGSGFQLAVGVGLEDVTLNLGKNAFKITLA